MAKKRKTTSSSENLSSKRLRPLDADDDGEPNLSAFPDVVQPQVDPTYGQRGAFPGLDCEASDALFYGPAQDGLEYLRMVRYATPILEKFHDAESTLMYCISI